NDPGSDADDFFCQPASESLRIQVSGCFATDNDFNGVSYQKTWPGSFTNPGQDNLFHPRSILFSSPTFNGGANYSRVAFEADLPRIEAADFGGHCNRTTGANCVNPPPGANFYPLYSTRNNDDVGCFWQLGGVHIPGTTNTFGGTSTAEFGPLLFLDYPGPGFVPIHRTNDFLQILGINPCRRSKGAWAGESGGPPPGALSLNTAPPLPPPQAPSHQGASLDGNHASSLVDAAWARR